MIPVVYQNRNLRKIHRFALEVGDIVREHLNESAIITDVRFGAVGKERKPQAFDCQMTFDAVGCLVMAKPFGGDAGITGVLNCLGVDHN